MSSGILEIDKIVTHRIALEQLHDVLQGKIKDIVKAVVIL